MQGEVGESTCRGADVHVIGSQAECGEPIRHGNSDPVDIWGQARERVETIDVGGLGDCAIHGDAHARNADFSRFANAIGIAVVEYDALDDA